MTSEQNTEGAGPEPDVERAIQLALGEHTAETRMLDEALRRDPTLGGAVPAAQHAAPPRPDNSEGHPRPPGHVEDMGMLGSFEQDDDDIDITDQPEVVLPADGSRRMAPPAKTAPPGLHPEGVRDAHFADDDDLSEEEMAGVDITDSEGSGIRDRF